MGEGDLYVMYEVVQQLFEGKVFALPNDLSAELVHSSNGVIARYEAERLSFAEEISDLRDEIGRLLSGDENEMRRENESLRAAIDSIPEFKLLKIILQPGKTPARQE